MRPCLRRCLVALVLLLFTGSLAVPALAAPTPEERIQALEQRVDQLERALALSTIDAVSITAQAAPAVVSLYLVTKEDEVVSCGTGFIFSGEGLIFTNAHVVDADYAVKAKFYDGTVQEATRLLVDPFLDMAILGVEGEGYPTLAPADKTPAVGSPVVVIGNAWGYSNTVTTGIVSGVDRPNPNHFSHYPSLQTDAAINHGNSGGPILNGDGEVVAMATWTELKGETDGIAFGIPIDQILHALDLFQADRGIVRPWLGIAVEEPYWTQAGLPNDLGLYVAAVHPSSAAAAAGIRAGQFITAVNKRPVNYLMELRRELERYKPGEVITLTLVSKESDYEPFTRKVKLGEYASVAEPLVPARYDPESDDLF